MDWMPLPVLFAVFAAFWLMFDAVLMLLSLRAYAREEITPAAVLHILRGMGHGICVADRRGWVLEANPAFYGACEKLGVNKFEHLGEFERALKTLHGSGLLKINELEDGKSIHTRNAVYFLQRSSFKTGKKTFIQTALSDVTKTARTVLELEKENERLAQNNQELEAVISEIELEETLNERQRLCRAAHDFWSQRLAVAGLSIDILLNPENRQPEWDTLEEIKEALKIPAEAKTGPAFCDLDNTLNELTAMYRRLGVKIQVNGGADFTGQEQEILCAVFREALANAVRHAYARQIFVNFYEDRASVGVTIRNRCLEDSTDLVEGRGLYDIRALVNSAGGAVQYQKNGSFVLMVTFLRQERAERILKEGQA